MFVDMRLKGQPVFLGDRARQALRLQRPHVDQHVGEVLARLLALAGGSRSCSDTHERSSRIDSKLFRAVAISSIHLRPAAGVPRGLAAQLTLAEFASVLCSLRMPVELDDYTNSIFN